MKRKVEVEEKISVEECVGVESNSNVDGKNPRWVQITKYSSSGEILSEVTLEDRKQNGSGFVLSYTEKMTEFITKYSTGAVVRMFLYLAHHQQYGVNGVYGFRCSHGYLESALGLTRKSVYSALMTLKNDFLVHECRVEGVSEFMVNPNYVTLGKDKKERMREWNARWQKTFKEQSTKMPSVPKTPVKPSVKVVKPSVKASTTVEPSATVKSSLDSIVEESYLRLMNDIAARIERNDGVSSYDVRMYEEFIRSQGRGKSSVQ